MSSLMQMNIIIVSVIYIPCVASIFLDTITPNQPIKDGDTLLSGQNTFALGFFSPGNSRNRYVGVWYSKIPQQTVVWVANRDDPINDTSGVLAINSSHGGLVIYRNSTKTLLWSSNASFPLGNGSIARLSDVGNLVLVEGDRILWESFDYPTHTYLPSLKLGLNRKTGLDRFLTCWKSPDDPGAGNCSYRFDMAGYPQLFSYRNSVPVWRTGSWTGQRWSGVPRMARPIHGMFVTTYVNSQDETTVMYKIAGDDTAMLTRFTIDESGIVHRSTWDENLNQWAEFWSAPNDWCDNYKACGDNGNCDLSKVTEFQCTCLPGYEPRSLENWNLRLASGGCVRIRDGNGCGDGEGFITVAGVKLPDTRNASVETNLTLRECEQRCLRDCGCTAYTGLDENHDGVGCLMWHGDLVDVRTYPGAGSDLHLRVDALTLAEYSRKAKDSIIGKVGELGISLGSVFVVCVLIFVACWLVKKRDVEKRKRKHMMDYLNSCPSYLEENECDESGKDSDIPLFHLNAIAIATGNFSEANKLGEGGFGSVYKGVLSNGKEIAVKRLSKRSGQGNEEFKNEIMLIAKLQHRNLVRILGCCFQKEEKMLVYEYLPNKSLDCFIFDGNKKKMLDWRKRYDIICGVARGMLYLHQDSRLRIIHRDLKASNVLLDSALNPKISDFGLARIFGGDQIEACTNRVVGTYGYMSPEYAMEGLFSIKSDVYSFGVLLLEIITGRKNTGHYHENPGLNLVGHVWNLWKESKMLEIVDLSMDVTHEKEAMERCIQIGLLCVQESPNERPTMSTIVYMLGNYSNLPSPKQPAFVFKKNYDGATSRDASTSEGPNSINIVTCTTVEAR